MSNLDTAPQETVCDGRAAAAGPVHELLTGREVVLGGTRAMAVSRTLPNRDRRMVGAWCFLDYYGPEDLTSRPGMRVPPHPHTGLQTVSWLFAGEVLHRDSLGNTQLIRPGQLNLMTAGHAISHAEQTPVRHSPTLHGVQLWTALADRYRHGEPHFEHHRSCRCAPETVPAQRFFWVGRHRRGPTAGSWAPRWRSTRAPTTGCRWNRISNTPCSRCPVTYRWTAWPCPPGPCCIWAPGGATWR